MAMAVVGTHQSYGLQRGTFFRHISSTYLRLAYKYEGASCDVPAKYDKCRLTRDDSDYTRAYNFWKLHRSARWLVGHRTLEPACADSPQPPRPWKAPIFGSFRGWLLIRTQAGEQLLPRS